MAKINKLALVRMTLRHCIKELSLEEKLCVLADINCPLSDGSGIRWFGGVYGSGASGLDQGIYGHMTTFRRMCDLWTKLKDCGANLRDEEIAIRNLLWEEIPEPQRPDLLDVDSLNSADTPLPGSDSAKRPQAVVSEPTQLKLAVNSYNGPYAPKDPKAGFSI